MNFSAMLPSLQSTVPFSVVPSVIAFLCIVTNCRFSRCNSDSVTLRAGKVSFGFKAADSGSVTGPPIPPVEDCSAMMADTMTVAVCSNVCSASEGAIATYTAVRYFEQLS